MKYVMLIAVLFCGNAFAIDTDGDGVEDSFITSEGVFELHDNCNTVPNPEQEEGYRYQCTATGCSWAKERGVGQACNYDLYPDGQFTLTDLSVLFNILVDQLNGKTHVTHYLMLGDYNQNGVYDFEDYTMLQCAAYDAGLLPYTSVPAVCYIK